MQFSPPQHLHLEQSSRLQQFDERLSRRGINVLSLEAVEMSVKDISVLTHTNRAIDSSIWLCIEFRKLNRVTIFAAEPKPTLAELLAQRRDFSVFIKIDLGKGYWQIPIEEESKLFIAFLTLLGLTEFNDVPYGHSTAALAFSRTIRKVGAFPHVTSYLDGIFGE
ncbi:Pol polyprotein [Plakobranchus ocellatus]|uniref:Pol polyprotein n=1 Tax=Plakobranchus ocellatus TaxID=259542 RepID=A0AAV3Z722_9GAST|nr:Pol polyprotein [Plakobranchus ocellatus]